MPLANLNFPATFVFVFFCSFGTNGLSDFAGCRVKDKEL